MAAPVCAVAARTILDAYVYGCANTTTLQKLRVKQKEALRVINLAGFREHTIPLFRLRKILPLDEMIKFANLKFMHNYIQFI
jgi:hypothetical protein